MSGMVDFRPRKPSTLLFPEELLLEVERPVDISVCTDDGRSALLLAPVAVVEVSVAILVVNSMFCATCCCGFSFRLNSRFRPVTFSLSARACGADLSEPVAVAGLHEASSGVHPL